jgi:3-oxoacyl-[acyl-carrier-protein] synthase I
MGTPLAIVSTGLVTPVGMTAPAACAAMRARVANPCETRFIDSHGRRIAGHRVPIPESGTELTRLVTMASIAILECLARIDKADWHTIPLLLCVGERDRPGRQKGFEHELFERLQSRLEIEFSADSIIVPHGRVAAAVALESARRILTDGGAPLVLVAGVDSMLDWPVLAAYEADGRLLSTGNSNGLMPGEGAGAILFGAPQAAGQLVCDGLGFGTEPAHISSGEPLRGDGLTLALKSAMSEAGRELHEFDLRICDISGEHYYFKEAALGLSRCIRQRREELDLWHPAQSTGETGAFAGLACLALAEAACRKRYSPGPNVICHFSNDNGRRAAVALAMRSD